MLKPEGIYLSGMFYDDILGSYKYRVGVLSRLSVPVRDCNLFYYYHFSYQDIKTSISGVTDVSRIYCQQCGYGIWVHLQSSQHCQDCGFSVHLTCLNNIMRGCVAQKIRTQPDFIMEICPEKSLPR